MYMCMYMLYCNMYVVNLFGSGSGLRLRRPGSQERKNAADSVE